MDIEIKKDIDSIKNRLDNIEDKLKIVNVIATAMMNRDIRESEKEDKEINATSN